MNRIALLGLTVGSALAALGTPAAAQCLSDKLLPSGPVPAANEFSFGNGAIHLDRVVLGRSSADVSGQFDQGRAQFFIRQGLNWVSDGVVTGSDSDGGDRFGDAVDIKNTTAVVGATFHQLAGQPGSGHGAVYVFDWFLFGGWTQDIKLTDPTPSSGARFGNSVSLDGNWIIAGAPFDDTAAGANTGSACIFQKVAGVWTFKQQLTDPAAVSNNRFGESVDVSGTHAVVGSMFDTVAGNTFAGSAQVYTFNGTNWVFQDDITAAIPSTSEEFGGTVAIDADTIVVGARLSEVPGNTSGGIVTVFRRSGSTWLIDQTIPNPEPGDVSFFGSTVAVSGNRITITSAVPEKVYIYDNIGDTWTLADTLTDPDGGSGQFGAFATLHGHNILVCDPSEDTAAVGGGAAYVFTDEENGSDSCDTPRAVGFGSLVGCNNDATTDGSAPCANSGKDIWFRLLVDCTGWFQIDTEGSDFDTVLSLYDGIDCPGALIACDDDSGIGNSSLIQLFAVKGDFIKIRVAGFGVTPAVGTFLLNTSRLAPFNDDCPDSIPVGEGVHAFGTCTATTDGFGSPACTFFGSNQVGQDVWFNYTASCSGTATINLCGADYDSKIHVYTGADCPAPAEIPLACADDTCGNDPSVTFAVTAGSTYKVRVGGFSTNTGSGMMTITNAVTCPGDADGSSPVGIGDLAVLINNWDTNVTGCNMGDLTGDGHVGIDDIAEVINNWAETCP